MHIEPGVVDGAKMIFVYATDAGALSFTAKKVVDVVKKTGWVV